MKKKTPTRDDLRSRAEEELKSGAEPSIEGSSEDMRRLIHELRVHEVELELQNEELRGAQARLEESRMRYADLYDFAPVGYLTFDQGGLIVEANLTAASQLGKERAILLKRPFFLFIIERDRDAFRSHLARVFKTRERQTCEVKLKPGKSEEFFARLDSIFIEDASGKGLARTSISDVSSSKHAEEVLRRAHGELEELVAERTAELSIANEQLKQEMEVRRQTEIQTQAANALLELLNEVSSRKEYLDEALEQIQSQTGCCCVGIRMLDEKGMIPYESYVGFSREFWEVENWVSVVRDSCVCTRIIAGQTEPIDAPYMTETGAFLCNDTFELAAGLTDEEKGRFRGSCIKHGFRSVAVIPVRHGEEIVGAIHLADTSEGMVPLKRVEFIESLASLIAAAVHKFSIQDRLVQNYVTQNVVNSLLRLSLEDVTLDEILGRGLDLVLSIPWLSLESMGSIFLIDDEPDVLVMKAQRGLPEEKQACCHRVPFGQCVCGQAILVPEIQLIRCPDGHHGLLSRPPPHSHYCIPILFSGKALGLINLYVNVNHREEPREQEFLTAVANTLAGIIQRKRVEETLYRSGEKYRELVENANSMIMRVDTKGNIVFCNEFAQRFFGYTEEELLGRNVLGTILPATDSYGHDLAAMVENIISHPERYVNNENENMRKSGERVWVAWTNKPIVDESGRIAGLLAVGTDITARKRAEDELSAYAGRLELVNRELQEFAFVASHDLQEPLRKIQTFGSLIEAKSGDLLGIAGRDYLRRMKKSANRMSELVKALFDYSQVAVKLEAFEKVDLAGLARDEVRDLLRELEQNTARVEIADLPTIDADRHQMKELFRNLISNALKFRRKEDPPAIRIYATKEKEVCTIFVEDNGIGFDERFLHKIFTPLQRLHVKGEYDGIGMGLAICRKIAERHKGSLAARSTPGRGSTFIITLPLRQTGAVGLWQQ